MSFNDKITPYFLISLKTIKLYYNLFIEAIKKTNRFDMVAYAIKANYDTNIINVLNELGAYFEVGSYYEYSLLKQNNINPKKIIINGTIKNQTIIEEYLKSLLIIDSYSRLEWVNNLNKEIKIGLRINLDYIKDTNDYKEKNSRLGIDLNSYNIEPILKNPKIKIICLHAHLQNHTKKPEIYQKVLKELCNIINTYNLKDIEKIDIGGGYKIHKDFYSFEDYLNKILGTLKENKKDNIKLIYEPGNSIVMNSTTYNIKVIDKKKINNILYIITDGTRHHLPNIKNISNSKYTINYNNNDSKEVKIQVITGMSCKSSDIFFTLENQREIEINDIITFYDVGGYNPNQITNFLIEAPNVYYL